MRFRTRIIFSFTVFLSAVSLGLAQTEEPREYIDRPFDSFYENNGTVGIVQHLRKLSCGVRVLHIAAHPDDEDSPLIAYLSLGRGARVTYLSLTRGEGGQNLIGPEVGEDLGILRTSELLAARKIDGAGQLFGRMIDFGYSKTAEEAFEMWGRENIVEDIALAIRRTRPHIVHCRFTGTPFDGHGQHQVSTLATFDAIEAAADPTRFPEQIELGYGPWEVQKFYTGHLFGPVPDGALKIPTDVYDPLYGRSLGAIGYEGRSQHRSQDMGMIEYEDSRASVLVRQFPDKGGPAEADLFDGLDIGQDELRAEAKKLLDDPAVVSDPVAVAPKVAKLLDRWREEFPEEKESIRDLNRLLGNLLGIRLEAFADKPALYGHEEGEVNCSHYRDPGVSLDALNWEILARRTGPKVESIDTDQWEVTAGQRNSRSKFFRSDTSHAHDAHFRLKRSTPKISSASRPERKYLGENSLSGSPFAAPAAIALLTVKFKGTEIQLYSPVEYRQADPAYGEIRRDLEFLSELSADFIPTVRLLASRDTPTTETLLLQLRNQSSLSVGPHVSVFGKAEIGRARELLSITPESNIELGPEENLQFAIPFTSESWDAEARALKIFEVSNGLQEIRDLDYRHIRPRYLVRPAEATIYILDVELPEGLRIGYVQGTGDEVGESMSQLGAEVVYLDEEALANGDLSGFDAIVTGVRAYEVREDLVANNARLLDYARAGGTLVVQYNKYAFAQKNVAPLPMSFARPHDRVTNEDATVELLRPEHPIFHYPNEITAKDFEGWIQDKGLYFWNTWDGAYVPLMASADRGEAPKQGGMMYLPMGEGHYIYTGYAFFRQLPGGVEGAARLFANLVSLGRSGE